MAVTYVSKGQVVKKASILGFDDVQHILNGGQASNTTLTENAAQIVSGGGSTFRTAINGYSYGSSGGQTVLSEGLATSTTISSGNMHVYGSAAKTTLLEYGAYQYVYEGGSVTNTTMSGGGQYISKGGLVTNTTISSGTMQVYGSAAKTTLIEYGANQYVYDGGRVTSTTMSGGYQYISDGGLATSTTILSGTQTVFAGGSAVTTLLKGFRTSEGYYTYGSQTVEAGGKATGTTISRGYQNVYGTATSTTVNGGGQSVYNGGTATKTTVKDGSQTVYGKAISTTVSSGGDQYVESGGSAVTTVLKNGANQYVSSGGVATGTTVSNGGYMHVYGKATNAVLMGKITSDADGNITHEHGSMYVGSAGVADGTKVNNGGLLNVSYSGKATNTTITSGGSMSLYGQTVFSGDAYVSAYGSSLKTVISSGGSLSVSDLGLASNTTISKGGSMTVSAGGSAATATVLAGGEMTINQAHYYNTIAHATGVTVKKDGLLTFSGGESNFISSTAGVTFKAGASMGLGGYTKLGSQNVTSRTVLLTARANNLTSMTTNAKSTNFIFDLSALSPNETTKTTNYITKSGEEVLVKRTPSWKDTMLRTSVKKAYAGNYSVDTSKTQATGTYVLSDNISLAKGKAFTINVDGTKATTAKLNSGTVSKNGLSYTLTKASGAGQRISLSIDLKAGNNKFKNTAKTVKGTADSDIFYGGKTNNTIDGNNGRDVAVYDTTAWGQDTIKKTKGTMTILFKDIEEVDVTTKLNKGTMTITRDGYSKQQIKIEGWNNETHKIVYAGTDTMTAFDAYLKKSNSTTIAAARTEVWQKAGLAATA